MCAPYAGMTLQIDNRTEGSGCLQVGGHGDEDPSLGANTETQHDREVGRIQGT